MDYQQKSLKTLNEFNCEHCDYITGRKSDYIKHCSTQKHIKQCNINRCQQKTLYTDTDNDKDKMIMYVCNICNKQYKDRSGLWRHKQAICIIKEDTLYTEEQASSSIIIIEQKKRNPEIENEKEKMKTSKNMEEVSLPERVLLIEFIKQNQELRDILLEEREESRSRYNEQTAKIEGLSKQNVIINNNNHFNLNIFLNEKCKDAINMIDFINSLQVGTNDVEYTGRYGYVEGITKIFIDGLKQLDVCKRPIHCTDLKRETLYIKEDNCWEKDNQDKTKFKKSIGAVVRKNMQQVKLWKEENPKFDIMYTKEYELHLNIMSQSLGGGNQEKTDKNNEKIIKNISKQVLVDRMNF